MGVRLGLVTSAVVAMLVTGCSSTETMVISDAASLPDPSEPSSSPASPPSYSDKDSKQRSANVPEQTPQDSWQSPLGGLGLD